MVLASRAGQDTPQATYDEIKDQIMAKQKQQAIEWRGIVPEDQAVLPRKRQKGRAYKLGKEKGKDQ